MDDAELEVKRNSDKQLVILKTTFFIILPVSIFFVYFKSEIIHFFIQQFNLDLSSDIYGFIYIILSVLIFKIALHNHNKKTKI